MAASVYHDQLVIIDTLTASLFLCCVLDLIITGTGTASTDVQTSK